MDFIQKNIRGFLLCLLIALPCQYLGNKLPLIGGPVFGILAGMVITRFLPFKETVGFCNMADCMGGRAVYSFHFLFTSIYNQAFKKEHLSSDFREIVQDI